MSSKTRHVRPSPRREELARKLAEREHEYRSACVDRDALTRENERLREELRRYRLAELIPNEDVLAADLQDPEFRKAWER